MSSLGESPTPRRSPRFSVDQRDRATVVLVEGELDLVSAPQLKDELTKLLHGSEGRLVLDLDGVPFMDSTALSVLVGVQRRLGPDQRMAIATARPEVLRVFELSGLAVSFQIFPTVDAALAYAQRGDGDADPLPLPPLTADAALMVGIASTAMPFAQSQEDEVERWLRVLHRHGEAGAVLTSLGVSEAALRESVDQRDESGRRDPDPVATVTAHAGRIATQHRAVKTATTDVLLAVMHLYGAMFDRVLAAHGGDIDELAARVAIEHRAAA